MSTPSVPDPFFRAAPEPGEDWPEARVHGALIGAPKAVIAYARALLSAIAAGRIAHEQPRKQLFSDPSGGGDFRVMPCVLRGAGGALKTIKIVGTDRAQAVVPGKITVGKAFALHPVENFITHSFDACLLSSARTGLCAALAVERLAKRRGRVGIIGAGRVGWYAGLYLAHLGGFEDILFVDLDRDRARVCAALLAEHCPGVNARAVDELPGGLAAAVLATTSATPFFARPPSAPPLVIATGADTPDQRELMDDWTRETHIFADTLDGLDYGDLLAWRTAGQLDGKTVTTLLDLYAVRLPDDDKARVFVSSGSALMDAVAIGYLLDVRLAP